MSDHSRGTSPGRTARLVTTHPRRVLAVAALLTVLAAVLGIGVFGSLKSGGFDDPAAESTRAQTLLADRFGVDQANLLLLVTAHAGTTVSDPAVAAAGRGVAAQLAAEPGVRVLGSFWDASGPAATGLRSRDGTRGLVVAHIAGDEQARGTITKRLSPAYTRDLGAATVATGGAEQGNLDTNTQVTKDLATAESLAVPLTLVLLVVVFGSVVAGLLPLLVGTMAILGTFASLAAATAVTDVSVFALNLTTALGIGLGVDYALLVVSRFREELARGREPAAAIAVTLRTAGRTILFSAATVAVALAAMLVFPLYFLRSFAYAGISVVVVATLAALVVLPAVLVVLGPRVDRLSVPWLRGRGQAGTRTSGGWARLARIVMRRPVLIAAPVLALLAIAALPLAGVRFGTPDERVLQSSVQSRQVGDALRAGFDSQDAAALHVVLPRVQAAPGGASGALTSYASALSVLPGVARVSATTGVYAGGQQVAPAAAAVGSAGAEGDGQWLSVVPSVDAHSAAAQELVRGVRATPAPGQALVAGPAAALVDGLASIGTRLWLAGLLIAVSTFVLLFLFTGSVVLPVKALLLNLLSLGSVLGAMTWVFQDGHLSSVLGFTPSPVTASMPILLFCVAFGLSMDYEVFLLSRIKEEHDAGASTREAVAAGLERTGRMVTTAAALLSITFFAFGTSGVSFIQFFGIGTGLAIVVDATLVRGVLVPAIMRLMGEANWWAPAPLRRLHARVGLREGTDEPVVPAALPAPRPEIPVTAGV